jgi:DNA-binding HxlR family transcriptional regulator
VCSITDALAIVGDHDALLVARELRYGQTRFQEIAAGTKAPATSSRPGCASSSRPA